MQYFKAFVLPPQTAIVLSGCHDWAPMASFTRGPLQGKNPNSLVPTRDPLSGTHHVHVIVL